MHALKMHVDDDDDDDDVNNVKQFIILIQEDLLFAVDKNFLGTCYKDHVHWHC